MFEPKASMPSVYIAVPEPLAARLLDECRARGKTVSEFIEFMFDDLDPEDLRPKSMTYSAQMEEAIARAERIPSGEEFTLARLFPNDWKSLPSPTAFGRLFRQELESRGIAVLSLIHI